MLKRIFESKSKTIISAAVILGAASLISRLLGIVRDRVLASEFGAGIELDMYYTAFRIPDMIFNLIVLGALSAGFIPVYMEYISSQKKANTVTNVTMNVMISVLLVICAFGIFLAPWLNKIIAPGFTSEQLQLTTVLSRIMFLSPMLLGISGIVGGILQAHRQFFVYALSPIMYNIGIIIGALFLVPIFGLAGLAWGVVLGAFLHLLILIPTVIVLGYRYKFEFNIYHPGFKKILKMMVPRTLTLVISQINFVVITIIGSMLAAGSIAVYNLAMNIQSFPLGIFGVSFAIAAFPALAELKEQKEKFVETLSQTIRQMLFFIVPSAAFLIVLRAQVVRLILGGGLFSWEDTILTLNTLSLFAISLFAQSLILLFSRAYYALEDSKTPFYTGLVSVFANIILSLILSEIMGVLGLALAFSLSYIFNLVLLFLLLQYRLGRIDSKTITISSAKILVSTFMLALAAQAAKYPLEAVFGTATFGALFVQAAAAIAAGAGAYIATSIMLKTDELYIFVSSFKRKFFKKPVIAEEIIEKDSVS